MRKHGHPVRRVTVWPCRSNGHGKWLLAVCRRYFTVIISHPKCFLISEILILNRWHDHLLKTFRPRKQAEKLTSKNYYYIWLESSMKYETFLSNFSWTMQTFMKGILCASGWMRNGFCFLRSLGLVETKAILPCQSTVKTKTKSQWVAYH